MSLGFDKQFARGLMNRLQSSKVTQAKPFKLNFRCPVCGDSKKDKLKTRAWIYEGSVGNTKGVVLFNCFNCNNNGRGAVPIGLFIREQFPHDYDRYRVEMFKESMQPNRPLETSEIEFNSSASMPKPRALKSDVVTDSEYYTSIKDLPDEHVIKRYIQSRCIPEKHHKILGFTMTWRAFIESILPDSFSEGALYYDHPRVVIPFYNEDGDLIGIQGRSLSKDHTPRYQTFKMDDSFDKIYGLDRVNTSKPVIVVEGPIDSLFLDNGIAMAGGAMSTELMPIKNRVWCLDNEPRSVDTVARMQKLIGGGERVVFWDKLVYNLKQYKDINDMVMKGMATIEYINEYINKNYCSGLTAQMRLNNWAKARKR